MDKFETIYKVAVAPKEKSYLDTVFTFKAWDKAISFANKILNDCANGDSFIITITMEREEW